jgi:hypothetical protein
MLLERKREVNVQIYAKARWEMRLKALGYNLRSTEPTVKGIGDSLGNARRVLETF